MMCTGDSIEALLQRWSAGDHQAAEKIYEQYAGRLLALAKDRLSVRLRRRVGEDDIVQSVFRTFFRRVQNGEYLVDHSGTLWQLLVSITLNKLRQKAKFHRAQKRDVGAEVYRDADQLASGLPTARPDEAAIELLMSELDTLFHPLDGRDRQIAQLCLEGYATSEIGQRLRCSRWTIRRVLDRIGARLSRQLDQDLVDHDHGE
jgi:RNA polymerase sigma-70 factor (ECF subfamily)